MHNYRIYAFKGIQFSDRKLYICGNKLIIFNSYQREKSGFFLKPDFAQHLLPQGSKGLHFPGVRQGLWFGRIIWQPLGSKVLPHGQEAYDNKILYKRYWIQEVIRCGLWQCVEFIKRWGGFLFSKYFSPSASIDGRYLTRVSLDNFKYFLWCFYTFLFYILVLPIISLVNFMLSSTFGTVNARFLAVLVTAPF